MDNPRSFSWHSKYNEIWRGKLEVQRQIMNFILSKRNEIDYTAEYNHRKDMWGQVRKYLTNENTEILKRSNSPQVIYYLWFMINNTISSSLSRIKKLE